MNTASIRRPQVEMLAAVPGQMHEGCCNGASELQANRASDTAVKCMSGREEQGVRSSGLTVQVTGSLARQNSVFREISQTV